MFAGLSFTGLSIYWPFVLTAVIPVFFTLLFGRFYCGWICPATLLYELNTNLGLWLQRQGFRTGNRRFDRRLKYGVLLAGLLLSTLTGSVLVAAIYPPAIIGRELYYALALGGFGSGTLFFIVTSVPVGRYMRCSVATACSVFSETSNTVTTVPSATRCVNSV
jgi:ferredoxin-type protein NapH